MHLSIQKSYSSKTGDFLWQLQTCIGQIVEGAFGLGINRRIVKITVFTSCSDNSDYLMKMNLLNCVLSQYNDCQAPASLVSQPPMECGTLMEVWILDNIGSAYTFKFNRSEQTSVLYIDCLQFTCLFSTQYSVKQSNFKKNVTGTFGLLDTTLKEWAFDYNNIVRQWNYIENIILVDNEKDAYLQNYQIFNDLRALFYEKSEFTNGYPSATGIGTINGGCTIEVIVFKEKKRNTVKPVTNSMQIDAHSYSTNQLVGNAIEEVRKVSTPKFERGKFLQLDNVGLLFISGTASIIGEQTVYNDDVSKQTITTLQNIENLISMNNLGKNHINTAYQPRLLNYRVYLKNEADYSIVKSLCDTYFGIDKGFIVHADICRDNLLVEIEANYVA